VSREVTRKFILAVGAISTRSAIHRELVLHALPILYALHPALSFEVNQLPFAVAHRCQKSY